MRAIGISLLSLALTTVVIANAYYQKKQFYPSVVYITKSNPSLAVIYIQAFICVLLAGKLMRKIFFGELRASEFEHLLERFWYAITETCLAFTVFRDDFNPKFVSLFTILLFLKSFHWLAEDRVDYMERSPIISPLFHLRVLSLLVVLGALDIHFIVHAYESTVQNGASVQLVFGFEYAILATMVINVAIKYALYSVDLNSETPWDNKAVFLLYTELVMGLIKVLLYVVFVGIMVRIYTLPLFALRPMYYTARNFRKALNDVIMSRRAIHNMNTLYLDATAEELAAGDNVCIICREEMLSAAKKLPCNHIFHTACLRSWFQRQQTCPTCRLNILRPAANANVNNAANAQQQNRARPVPNNIPNPFMNMNLNGPNPFAMFNQQMRNIGQAAAAAVNPQQNPNIPQGGDGQGVQPGGTTVPPGAVPGSNTGAGAAGGMPTYTMPPFPPFPVLLTPPPMMPAQNISELTPEQLRQLEGEERENIEARIAWLRSIGIMLDTAVVMLQQYSTAAMFSRMPMATGTSTTTNVTSSTTTATTTTSTSTANSSTASTSAATASAATLSSPSTSTAACASSSTQETNVTSSTTSTTGGSGDQISTPVASTSSVSATKVAPPAAMNSSTAVGSSMSSAEDDLRRRRLQHFEQTTATTTANGGDQ